MVNHCTQWIPGRPVVQCQLNCSRVKNGKVNDRKWQLQSALENLILALRVFSFISHFEMHNLMVVNLLLVVFYQPSAAARTSMGRDRQMSRCPWLFQQQFPLHPLRPVITLQSLILDFLSTNMLTPLELDSFFAKLSLVCLTLCHHCSAGCKACDIVSSNSLLHPPHEAWYLLCTYTLSVHINWPTSLPTLSFNYQCQWLMTEEKLVSTSVKKQNSKPDSKGLGMSIPSERRDLHIFESETFPTFEGPPDLSESQSSNRSYIDKQCQLVPSSKS